MNINECGRESLDLVLSEQLDHPEYPGVVNHIGSCTRCQVQLEKLTAAESWWSQTRNLLSDSTAIDIPDLPRADTLVLASVGAPQATGHSSYGDPANFLAPPRHPEMLGRVGKYEVEREIGRGGMGIVVKGFDSELNRPVAIKLLAPHLASSGTARQRFIREAQAAAAVVHDNVVAIHGIETDGPLPAIVMPLIGGASLQEHVEQHGPLGSADVVRIGIQIADGLSAAHAQGLVHRDIKPANVLLENDLNRVQITDFGLARAAHDANLTRSGVITGTPHFMSPEQALGESVDQRSDLFSLGSVLYFMATGQLPFAGSTPMGVLQRVCNTQPQRVREANSGIPEQLESVIEKLFDKTPANRFQSAAEVRTYLQDYLAYLQQPTARKAPRRLLTAARRARRRNWVVRTTAVAVTVGACVLGGRAIRRNWSGSPTSSGGTAPVEPSNNASVASVAPSAPASPRAVPATYVELGVAPENTLDLELEQMNQQISNLEQTPAVRFNIDNSNPRRSLDSVAAGISALETPRSAGLASNFDKEVQSIDAALKRLEQESVRAQTPSPIKGQ